MGITEIGAVCESSAASPVLSAQCFLQMSHNATTTATFPLIHNPAARTMYCLTCSSLTVVMLVKTSDPLSCHYLVKVMLG